MPHRSIKRVLLLSGVMLLSGCAEHTSSVRMITSPAPEPGEEVMEFAALIYGTFIVEGDCLQLDTGTQPTHTPIFPHGFSLARQNGGLVILDAEGSEWAPIGKALRMGGGQIEGTQLQNDFPCPPPYWLLSSSVPVEGVHTPASSPPQLPGT